MADGLQVRVDVRGARQIEAALGRLPKQARDEARRELGPLTADLARKVRAAGRTESRQAARAARTVRATRGLRPGVYAGPHPLLFGSEFGSNFRWGWYRKARYRSSVARQFKPHRGSASYWFFRTVDAERPRVDAAAREIADRVIRRWST